MRDAVRDAFVDFTIKLEGGFITWMFPDIEGAVSTGFGLLLEPVAMALALPWKRADGTLASREEVVADWARVRVYPDAARLGHKSVEKVARLRLDRDGLYAAFHGKLRHNDDYLRYRFPDFESWPADAQLATHSMAWACGPAFNFPKMAFGLRSRDFSLAAAECHMDEWDDGVFNAGLVPRNKANLVLYRNAAIVQAGGMDPEPLHYPAELSEEVTKPVEVPSRRPPTVADWPIVYGIPPLKPPPLESPELDDEPPDEAA